jgi:glycerol-3-phosphate dehydrogenase (NAD(P)+)
MTRVAVIGTTSWGTTLAILMALRSLDVRLWARTPEEAAALAAAKENTRFVPGIPFPPSLRVTASLEEALHGADLVIFAVPSRSLRENARRVASRIPPKAVVVSATKGLERQTGKRMSQVLQDELVVGLHPRICALSGPNLAKEVAEGKPASTAIACPNEEHARFAQEVVMGPTFRVYTTQDIIGVELGGALKNIIALGAGVCDGLGYGANAKAAFMSRGLVEITRLGVAAGANPLTFAGLACLGDLIATCLSPLSRNRSAGEQLAQGRSLKQVLASTPHVIEGVETTPAALKLAAQYSVEMPITEATHGVLFEGLDPQTVARELMGRSAGAEWWGVAQAEKERGGKGVDGPSLV